LSKVYLDYTQEELDRAYDQRAYCANAAELIARYGTESAKARAEFAHYSGVAYGPSDDETLDIFPPERLGPHGAPVQIHIHGGSWRLLTKSDVSLLARTYVPAGVMLVALNFSVIPQVRIPEMAAQIRRAIGWVHANIARYGGDPRSIHLSGHSSGAHLAGVMLTTDWKAHGLPADVLKSGFMVSGMYDMHPVLLSARSSFVKLEPVEARALSAIHHVDRLVAPVTVAWGGLETPEFQRQPQAFADAVVAAGKPVARLAVAAENHFAILERWADPKSSLANASLQAMEMR
jgi:arylformamidase